GRCACIARRPETSSAPKSPTACASSSVANENGSPGMARSGCGAAVISRKTPLFGPPLCSWPVECRERGPYPNNVAVRALSRTGARHARRARPSARAPGAAERVVAGRDVGKEGEIVTVAKERQEPFGIECGALLRRGRQRQRDAARERSIGRRNREPAGRLELRQQRLRRVLCLLHVRLIE